MIARTLNLPKIATIREQRAAWSYLLARRNRARRQIEDEPTVPPITSPADIAGLQLWLDGSAGAVKTWTDAPVSGGVFVDYSPSSGYTANGNMHTIRIYPFKTVSGSRVYSASYLELSVSDDNSSSFYFINWSWDSVVDAEGYRVLKQDVGAGFFFDYSLDVGPEASFVDSSTGLFSADGAVNPIDESAAAHGDAVGRWEDQSGQGNHATQLATARKPSRQTNVLNGRPVLRFDDSDDGLLTSLNLGTPCTVFVVYSFRGTENDGRRAIQGSNNWLIGPYALTHDFFQTTQFATGPAVVQNQFVAQAAWQNGASSRNWVNGAFVGSTVAAGDGPGIVGLATEGTYAAEVLNGDIAEVIIYNSALSDTDLSRVWDYLASKYALS
jgi:hypothetical protein